MPTFQVIRGATTYNISAGQSICLVDVDDLGGASVRNQEETGPYQDGSSHISQRLDPSVITLRLNVIGTTAAALDGLRDTLNAMFKPIEGVPITLKVTRDDGEIRQIDTWREGRLSIKLEPRDYPGHLHRAVVQLRASDPTWYNPAEQDEVFLLPGSDWWTGFSTIGTANVLEHVTSPGTGQLWANSGSVAAGSPWTIFFRSGSVTPDANTRYAFYHQQAGGVGDIYFAAENGFTGGYRYFPNSVSAPQGAFMGAGTASYFLVSNGGTAALFRDGTLVSTVAGTTSPIEAASASGTARWRSIHSGGTTSSWAAALPFAAIYSGSLSPTQRDAVHQAVTLSGSAQSAAIAYGGDWYSYPVITINGPLANPVITNTNTGDILDFTGGTVGSTDIWIIDTRYGYKSALSGTVSVEQYLSNESDLATFRLAPDPIVAGGTNVITVSGSAMGSATAVTLTYYERFMDY